MANSPSGSGSALPLHLQSALPSHSVGSPSGSSESLDSPSSPQRQLNNSNNIPPHSQGSPSSASYSVASPPFSGSVIQTAPSSARPFSGPNPFTANPPDPVKSPPPVGVIHGPNSSANGSSASSSTTEHAKSPAVSHAAASSAATAALTAASSSAPSTSSKKSPAASASVASSTTATSVVPKSELPLLLSKDKLDQLTKSVDPNLKLDDDVQEFLQQYAGELVDEIATMSAKLAQARKSKVLEVQDVKYYLEHNWNMFIPGFGADAIKAKRKLPETEAHKNRQAIIKKHLKKF
ncbi:putative Transcription initiation factor TFIID subunit 12 [Hypsibius exemplaris]|uniref:Transcription initiation factor TFIID subunit 12 n=1 Tax=Hypsibius exemplaris TaxID=2072580 RepID=A0A1W0WSL5_HYPEX|nr:putative Transcription initiation factor TFIID subunit 12 [Hypsibius exemplaris]